MSSVSLVRKQELLLEARSARLSWICANSSPYHRHQQQQYTSQQQQQQHHHHAGDGDDHADINLHDMAILTSSRAGEVTDNAVSIVSLFYDTHLLNDHVDGLSNNDSSGGTVSDSGTGQKELTAADVTNRLRLGPQWNNNRRKKQKSTRRKGP